MIIVSQDKDLILIFNNTESIAILNPLEDNDGLFRVCAITPSDKEYTLGKYKTEERAKEVLQEIISRYEYAQRNLADSNEQVHLMKVLYTRCY